VRIACIGGGPGGLFLSALVRRELPDAEVVVFERNRAEDTFGFGVVFSNATLGAIDAADPVLRDALLEHGRHWDEIEVRVHGQRLRCGGNGMASIVRSTLLGLLQERARDAGVDLRFQTEVRGPDELEDYDLVVAADGANSRVREQDREVFAPSVDVASAKFIWLGTTYPYEGLTFVHEAGPHGVFAAHAYPIGGDASTFIVETDEDTWRRAGLDAFDVEQPPGPSDEHSIAYLRELFGHQLEGHELVGNNSRWGNFRTLRTGCWSHGDVVLLGDAAHTAHFSVGSGTKMAMEDAVVLARTLGEHPDELSSALERYEQERRPAVEKVQGASVPSLSWWEHFGRYHRALDAPQFVFHFLSRSISRSKLQQRDPGFVAEVDRWWHRVHGALPLSTPLETPAGTLPGRSLRFMADGRGPRLVGDGAEVSLTPADDAGGGAAVLLEVAGEGDGDGGTLDDLVRGRQPALLVLRGGDDLDRTLLSERARMEHGVPTVLVGDHDEDAATTLVLSGRADAVASPAAAGAGGGNGR
jgi:salicyloyl-CoA 5-hydroxylase